MLIREVVVEIVVAKHIDFTILLSYEAVQMLVAKEKRKKSSTL